MNVSELYDLTHWVTDEIEETQIPQKYQTLHTIIQRNSQANQQKQPFESQKDDLIESLRKVPLDKLTGDQLAFLEHLNIADAVGENGVNVIEDILYRNVIDIATTAKKLQHIHQMLAQGIEKSTQIKNGLSDCVFEEEYETDNQVLMRVSFTGHALMKDVTDFKSWGSTWYDIGRGVAMAHDMSPEDVKIVGATRGSIIIELAVVALIAKTTSSIILSALKVADKVLDIKLKAEQLRSLQLKNNKLVKDLENEADKEKGYGIEEITKQISKELGIKNNGDGDKVKALDTAVKSLVNFIEKGGIVDFVIPDDESEEEDRDENEDLRVAFSEIRRLEKKIALIEHQSDSNEDNSPETEAES